MSKMIHQYSMEEREQILHEICGKIYIARNISMNHDEIIKQLKIIDQLFRTPSEFEDMTENQI